MKAIVYTKYGTPDVLELKEVEKPVAKDTEVLIKVRVTSVTPADIHFRSGTPFLARQLAGSFLKPKITTLDFDIAGEIESVGKNVQRLKEGDQVYGFVPFGSNGACAEYICVPENNVIIKPNNLTFEEAAAIPTGATIALLYLQAGNIQSGQSVLINGASGGLGTFAVQLAKTFSTKVTAVCSTANLEMVRSLGADEVIDYTRVDFTKNDQTYDLIFDVVGKNSFPNCKSSLNPKGVYISTMLSFQILLYMFWTSVIGSKKAKFAAPRITTEVLKFVKDLIINGKLKSIIDKCYSIEKIVDAHRYVEKGHAKGKVVITIV